MNKKKVITIILAGAITISTFVGCGKETPTELDNSKLPIGESSGEKSVTKQVPMIIPKPKELGGVEKYDYEFLGIEFAYNDELKKAFNDGLLTMTLHKDIENPNENPNENPVINWVFLPVYDVSVTDKKYDDIKDRKEFDAWITDSIFVGGIGVYSAEFLANKDIAEITGCETNTEVGKTEDEKFVYYVSYNNLDSNYDELLSNTTITTKPMVELPPRTYILGAAKSTATNMGEFNAQDILGNEITKDIFADFDLTLVNVFTTWCGPCVAEIPHLAEIDKEMAERGVNVVGIVMDINEKGSINEEKLAKAKAIAEKTGAEYEFIIPDDALRKGRLKGIGAYPETFFVDSKGNIIGDVYVGSRSKEEWISIIEKELSFIKE